MVKKIGIIGLGAWAEKIVRTLKEFDDVEIVAACQRKLERPDWLPPCQLFHDIDDLLRNTTIDYLITAVPPQTHTSIINSVKDYNIPVWLEKPVALSLEDAKTILTSTVPVFIDNIHLFSECFHYFLNITASNGVDCFLGTFGDIPFDVIRTYGIGFAPNPGHDFSVIYDYAVHDLSMLCTMYKDLRIDHITNQTSKNGEAFTIALSSNERPIFVNVRNDGCYAGRPKGKQRLLEIDIDPETTYCYDGLAQTVLKNGEVIFKGKELPLKHALRYFFAGTRADKEMNLRVIELLDEAAARVK
jgi:Oxidoreductase family, NAD-binding Rossmann fold